MTKKYIYKSFEAIVSLHPEHTALVEASSTTSYASLNSFANQLSSLLLDIGLSADDALGVLLPSGKELVGSLLSCFKTGITYVPLSNSFSLSRMQQAVSETSMKVLVTDTESWAAFQALDIEHKFSHVLVFKASGSSLLGGLDLDFGDSGLIALEKTSLEVYTLNDSGEATLTKHTLDAYSETNLSIDYPLDNSSYIFYSSGTTGKSKAIVGNQESIAHYVNWHKDTFGFDTESRVSQIAAVTFDASLKDILTSLISGSCLCIPNAKTRENMVLLGTWLADEKITILQTVPSLFRLLSNSLQEQKLALTAIKEVVLAGEKLYGRDVALWRSTSGNSARMSNLYGLTETTVLKSCYHIPTEELDAGTVLPVGKAISNTLIAIINEKGLCNRGEIGEIYIKSPYVSKGYLDQELTANLFVQNPLVTNREDIVCKTGDIGRYDTNGNIEILGRVDDQIKLHGVRVELDGIRSALLNLENVDQVELIVHTDDTIDSLLCYFSGQEYEAGELRNLLSKTLDRSSVPDYFMHLEEFPLTLNGKVDKRALPKPSELLRGSNYEEPKGAIEESLSTIWSELLSVPQHSIGRNDSFFNLGGSSLKAIQLISRVYKIHEVQLSIGDIFNHSELKEQAVLIGESKEETYSSIVQVATQEDYGLSHAQRRTWLIEQQIKGISPFNGTEVYRLEGNLDIDALTKSFTQLINRHESLRTIIILKDGAPRQKILKNSDVVVDIETIDISETPERRDTLITELRHKRFDLSQWPLFRVKLLWYGADVYDLVFVDHHIISDEWSMQILVRDLVTYYNGSVKGEETSLEALPIQYKDYAAWQSSAVGSAEFDASGTYWKTHLAEAPRIDLASDRPRPEVMSHKGAQHHFSFSKETSAGLKELCSELGCTLFMGVSSLVYALLYRYTGQSDITLGTPVAGRDHADLENQIGLYLNTLALRAKFSGEDSFRGLLAHVKEVSVAGFNHQTYPFDLLAEELEVNLAKNRSPLFDVVVILQNVDLQFMDALEMEGLEVASANEELQISKGDIRFQFVDREDCIEGGIEYSTDLYDADRITRMVSHLDNLLLEVISTPDASLKELTYLGTEEQSSSNWFLESIEEVQPTYIHKAFETIVSSHPEHAALVESGSETSYKVLNSFSNQLSGLLLELGLSENDALGVLVPSGKELVGSLLSCLKTGITYVPLSNSFSLSRMQQAISETSMKVLVTDAASWTAFQTQNIEHNFSHVLVFKVSGSSLLGDFDLGDSDLISLEKTSLEVYKTDASGNYELSNYNLESYSEDNISVEYPIDNSSYIFYSSGTTGKSKAIVGNQESIAQYINWHKNTFGFNTESRVSQIAAVTFDASLKDILTSLISGSRLCIPNTKTRENMILLGSWLAEEKITILQTVPSLFRLLTNNLQEQNVSLTALQEVVLAGEKLYGRDVALWRSISGHSARMSNLYGLTETTVLKSCYHIPEEELEAGTVLSVGKAIDNSMIAVINDSGLSMWGEIGEVYIKSPYFTKGYIDQELTGNLFVQNPLVTDREDLVCKTGDIGRYDSDGNLEILGRIDDQIKLHGVRVELDGIRSSLLNLEKIGQVELIVHNDTTVDSLLCYYSGQEYDAGELRSLLSANLDRSSIPDYFMYMEEFPLTLNGKVDKRALPKPSELLRGSNYEAPKGAIEESLSTIWAELLSVPQKSIGRNDSFFNLGGSSLKAIQLISRVYKQHEVQLSIGEIFNYSELKAQALLISESKGETYVSITKIEEQEDYALSHAQRRLWVLDQLQEDFTAYSRPISYDIEGELNIDALTQSFKELIERHESLRTTFILKDGGEPRQLIQSMESVVFEIPVTDVSEATDQEASIEEILAELAAFPYDLASGPLFKVILVNLGNSKHRLLFSIHHIISDEWSMQVLIRDLISYYNTITKGEETTLEALPIQYKDYAAWQLQELAEGELANARNYWLSKLDGELPILNMPSDYVRPAVQTYNGAQQYVTFSKEVSNTFINFVKEQDSTLFMGLVSLTKALLYRYSGQEDIIVGTPIAGREHSDLENQIGFYINNLALRTEFAGSDNFTSLLNQVKQTCLDGYENQSYPFDLLVDELDLSRDLSRFPLYDVVVVLATEQATSEETVEMEGLDVSSVRVDVDTSLYDITFWFKESAEGEIAVHIEYNTDIYGDERMKRLGDHLGKLLESVVANSTISLDKLPLIEAEERIVLLNKYQGEVVSQSSETTLVSLFEAQVNSSGNAEALQYEGATLSYQALEERSNQLAQYLQAKHNIQKGSIVAIIQDRSENLLISILGILKAGGAYLPIDKNYPSDRIEYMLSDGNVSLVIGDSAVVEYSIESININKLQEELQNHPTTKPAISLNGEEVAYVIYTSGSTGRPKGVQIKHSSVVNYLDWANENYYGNEANYPSCLFTSLSFDLTVTSLWSGLLRGDVLNIVSSEEDDLTALQKVFTNESIKTVKLTPSHIQVLAGLDIKSTNISVAIVGGEALTANHVSILKGLNPAMKIYNEYGPTETTVGCSVALIEDANAITIGRPIQNTTLYVLDKNHELVPIGVQGELYVGGLGVFKGYIGNEDLTAERTLSNPFGEGTLYKTGDIVSWDSEGNLHYHGRKDDQVKIQGHRIELGELSGILSQSDLVTQFEILTVSDESAASLVVYYIGSEEISSEIKTYLEAQLPAYMVPSYYVGLEEFPLTSNGKLDKSKLPSPQGVSTKTYIAPETDTEILLAEIWSELLLVPQVGKEDNFFELGGNSLKAIRLVSTIGKNQSVEISLKDIFTTDDLAALAALIDQQELTAFKSIENVAEADHYIASYAQKRMWALNQFNEARAAYNTSMSYWFHGDLNIEALNQAFLALIERHEILRTVFKMIDDEVRQIVLETNEFFKIDHIDLKESENGHAEAQEKLRVLVESPLDLENGPLIKVAVFEVSEGEFLFTLVNHHIISDEWSVGIIIEEIQFSYNEIVAGKELALEPLSIQYKDYAAWEAEELEGDEQSTHKTYWLEKLAGEITPLELPTDYIRPPVKTFSGAHQYCQFDTNLAKDFNTLVTSGGNTMFMGVLSLVKTLLYRYTGTKDIVIGTPISGRTHPDLENQIGFYLNTLVLRNEVSKDMSYQDLLAQVKQTCLEAYEHQLYPFDLLVEELQTSRDLSRSPLFDVMVVWQDGIKESKESINGVEIEEDATSLVNSKFDITFYFSKRDDELHLTVEYNTSLFSDSRILRMVSHIKELLQLVVAAPQTNIGQYDYLAAAERSQILVDFNNTAKDYPLTGSFLSRYEENVIATPEAIAIYFADRAVSYGELDTSVNQLSNYLKENYNVKQGDRVGLLMDRSEWMLISMLSILKLGGIYLPMDKSYPNSRISYILEDGGADLLISDIAYEDESDINMMILPEKIEELSNYSSELTSAAVDAYDLAYMIYTSGSTGTPKGVKIKHRSVTNLMYAMEREVSATASDSLLAVTTYAFDMSVVELFLPLHVGGSVIIASTSSLKSPEEIIELFDKHNPTIMQATPGFWQMLVDAGWEGSETVRVITGGEALSLSLGQSLINYSQTIWNMYGPTETTVYATYKMVEQTQDIPYIGRPVDNAQSYILDEDLQLVPIGIVGTLYMSGAGIAVGYQNKEELTKKLFINHPYQENTVMYNTGDLCSWNEEGSIKYYGRIDHQIKIRGYRIELEEIVSAMLSYEGIQQSVVVGLEIEGEKHLAGYYTGEGIESMPLRTHLLDCLPEYMIPTYLIGLEIFPLTPNGKIDKRALPNPSEELVRVYVAPTNETEHALVAIWEEVLGNEQIGIKDNFFELGGHSLKGIQIVSRIYKAFSKKIELKNIFMYPVLGDLADLIINGDFEEYTPITKAEEQENYPPSYPQKRIWILEKLESSGEVYNMPYSYWLEGNLDKEILKQTFETIIERHEVFRTLFVETLEEPRQKIVPIEEVDFDIDYIDLRNEQNPKDFAIGLGQNASQEIFDLEEDLLIKVSLYQTTDTDYLFFFNIHHIIGDEWSLQILNREIITIYNALVKGEEHQLPVLTIQYKDFATWQQNELSGENLQRHKDYWMSKLTSDSQSLDITTDMWRPPSRKFNGDRLYFKIDANTTKTFQKLLAKESSTLFMGLLTLVKTMLIRYTGNDDLTIGTAITGRSHTDLEDQIGFYSNTLAFKSEYQENDSFLSFLQTVKTTVLEAFDHRIYPFDKLVDDLKVIRDLSRSPIIDVMVVLQDANAGDESEMMLEGLEIEETNVQMPISKFDLTYYFKERDGELIMSIEYDTDIFFKERIETMGAHLIQLLTSIMQDPLMDMYELNYLEKEEKQLVATTFSRNELTNIITPEKTLNELFEAQVIKHGDRIAIVDGEYEMTYKELNEKANQLAQYLKNKYDAKPEDIIGIIAEHNEWLAISILAVAKTGAAYLPMNSKSPVERLNYQLTNANVQLVLTDYFEEELVAETFKIPEQWYQVDNYPITNLKNEANTNNLAYVIYTSGSTGKPKGVMIEQAGLINLCEWHTEYYELTHESRVSMYASISFDASVWEFWPAVLEGATIYMAADKMGTGFDSLFDWIHEKEIDQVFLPTVACKFLKESGKEVNPRIKILTGGDTLGTFDKVPFALYNNYGPTEAVVVSTVFKVDQKFEDRDVPIGKPIKNKETYVLDKHMNPMPVGFEGELYIGGAGIARGYINNEELTKTTFIPNPFGEGRLYKTGDVVKWLADGNIEFIGRNDAQVNIRGLRIELGEIESNLGMHPLILQALVTVFTVQEDEYLIAYFMSDEVLEKNDLKEYLRDFLPAFMIPEYFIQVEKFPLTLNGKIDKRALPKPTEVSSAKYVAPTNESEAQMVEIWKEILEREEIGIEDNFFDIGGHSMKALQMVSRINAEMDLRINLGNVISAPFIKDLVELSSNYQGDFNNIITLTDVLEEQEDVFFFPPLMGASLAYMGIVKLLKDDFNCYGIQDNGFDFDEPFDKSLEDKAWNFSRQILEDRSPRKITLVGFSLGASIVFETAKILEGKGFETRLLLIDRNISRRKPKLTEEVIEANENELRYLEGWLRSFEYNEEQTARIQKLWDNNIELNNKYKQRGKVKGDIIAFKTKKHISNKFLNMKDWEKYTTGNFEHIYLEGNHYDAIQLVKNIEMIANELLGETIQS
ncbi:amino acid adenylation domain-containing protein [Kordia sp. YSTF-M3]|uniref:Amino acid adenylation domain-containing protein n=1 Tax=Kordia aestuariivivens TaxID=2759037 RepID=A0ABR7QEZ5_9FLAO|nr:non-ribosomal peptide synthetase [Kordia aestuariivivens]MBC8757078.1 amino acid adenylation domain-containing protein [Kordia aestuariivivens]